METVLLCRWGKEARKFGFIKVGKKLTFQAFALRRHFPWDYEDDVSSVSLVIRSDEGGPRLVSFAAVFRDVTQHSRGSVA